MGLICHPTHEHEPAKSGSSPVLSADLSQVATQKARSCGQNRFGTSRKDETCELKSSPRRLVPVQDRQAPLLSTRSCQEGKR